MSDRYSRTLPLYGDGIGRVSYVDHMGTDLTIVNSARVSFGNTKDELNDRDKRLVEYLVKHKHTSTFEHNVISFKFVVPLFIRSQHHRHRTWSYNEISRRYTDKGLEFYLPEVFRTQHKSNRQASNSEELINPRMWDIDDGAMMSSQITVSDYMKICTDKCLDAYNDFIAKGVCREQARMILPQNLYTEYYGTCNLSNLLKFIDLRTHEGAQWEIQKVAEACLEIASDLWPVAVGSYRRVKCAQEERS
jgi:thymidylate synthase (FAD)